MKKWSCDKNKIWGHFCVILCFLVFISGKAPDAGKDWGHKEKRTTEDEMVGWHHQINGHKFEQTLGDSEGQGSLAYCSPWGSRVRHD